MCIENYKIFDSTIRFNKIDEKQDVIDMSDQHFFIDRSPDEFAKFLFFLETHENGDCKPNRAQAEFFGFEFNGNPGLYTGIRDVYGEYPGLYTGSSAGSRR